MAFKSVNGRYHYCACYLGRSRPRIMGRFKDLSDGIPIFGNLLAAFVP